MGDDGEGARMGSPDGSGAARTRRPAAPEGRRPALPRYGRSSEP
ncbi:MAG: hypothetical protein AVDCRST_MAG69-585 [uncultured Solirubrobacteraceae bacterium]|uniref:Uncharacterized protein n=1 Tax=uncultured Solirubrobacteraceae bacterium TaxID=1162706 RepID=A0A6J4RP11_9ACTN|nr:MAG: hypothetical protein AVDCRST_MAG69-585 [uncultured Solirubrobacteraceae bacterium]